MTNLYKYLALVPSVGLVILGGYTWYLNFRLEKCQLRSAKLTIESIQVHDKIEQKVNRLSDPDLDKRLDKWMRD